MKNFNRERIFLAAGANGFARVCLDEALAWSREREMFGGKLIDQQVTRHKLADMAMHVEATQAMLELLAWRVEQGDTPVGEICLLKNQATQTMAYCASEAVQLHGGAGFMRGVKVERIYREVKVNAIGGGAEEVMRDLAARQLGFYA
ncbi:Acyl-CoA dehydrogenase [Hydrogenophaga sp. T4]|nr:Acyl-CoA dehydrogenase [Hydrogenophaga sp. T4]